MARSISAALLTAQQATQRKPAIRILINSVDYSSRLLFVEHHEDPYRDWATIILNNWDRGLDSVATATTNLLGRRLRIAYGYNTGEIVAEPNGDGAGNEYVETADLWVKSQQIISAEGQLVCQLYCEGQWMYLREQLLMALLTANNFEKVDPADVGSDPYYAAVFNANKTVYELIESVIENAMGWTLNAAPATDDGILKSFKPVFSLEEWPSGADILRRLVEMTKCYLRAKANLIWDVIFPQSTDAVNETYYSDQAHYFREAADTLKLVIPNRVVVFGGNPDKKTPWPTPIKTGDTGVYSGNYTEVLEPVAAPLLNTQEDVDERASAILNRYTAEGLSGYLIVPHDSRVELYDRVMVVDNRE